MTPFDLFTPSLPPTDNDDDDYDAKKNENDPTMTILVISTISGIGDAIIPKNRYK